LFFISIAAFAKDDDAPKVKKEKDWSSKVHQFNLHEHLMKPTKRDLEEGVENSRRLARNAVRLGVDDENHRRLVAASPPAGLVNMFGPRNQAYPSKLPRLQKDETWKGTNGQLPFGDGPGKFPGLPEGTTDFWYDRGNPQKMWEVVACPVAVGSFAEMVVISIH
jgi:hypothetical protein